MYLCAILWDPPLTFICPYRSGGDGTLVFCNSPCALHRAQKNA